MSEAFTAESLLYAIVRWMTFIGVVVVIGVVVFRVLAFVIAGEGSFVAGLRRLFRGRGWRPTMACGRRGPPAPVHLERK